MNITAIVLTKNEESNIIDCLDSIQFCDQILVIDDYSSDNTLELVRKFKLKNLIVTQRKLDGNFSEQRNSALTRATHDWVLFVDADERISTELKNEIIDTLPHSKYHGYNIPRKDKLWGKFLEYGETGSAKFLRLAKKDSSKWSGKVHEVLEVKGDIGQLQNPIIHLPHQSISDFIHEINIYSTLRAEELYENKTKSNILHIIFFPRAKFFRNYFLKKGFKDGTAGFIHAMIMSLHSFLVRGKLYLLWKGIKNT